MYILKKQITLVIILLSFFTLSGQNDTSYYENGKVRIIGVYKNKLRDGTWKFFYESGAIQKVVSYKMGALHGEMVSYYPLDSIIKEKGIWKNGVKYGIWESYYETGALKSKGKYSGIVYFENADLSTQALDTIIKNNPDFLKKSHYVIFEQKPKEYLKKGTWKYYYADGTLEKTIKYYMYGSKRRLKEMKKVLVE